MINNHYRAWGDLALILLGELSLLGLVVFGQIVPAYTPWLASIQVVLGLVYILFVPGYLLQAIVFARMEDLDSIERAGLSLGLSVALVPLLALLLDALPWGIRLWPITIGQSGLIVLLLLLTVWRRTMLPTEDTYAPDLRISPRRYWSGLERNEQRLILFMAGTLLIAGLIAAWVFLRPSPDKFLTEFYILGKEGLAENFPRDVRAGEPLQVNLGITNHERQAKIYRVDIWVQDGWDEAYRQLVAVTGPFTLEPGQTREEPLTWSMPWVGQDQEVEILLYLGVETVPYRRLHLFVNVEP